MTRVPLHDAHVSLICRKVRLSRRARVRAYAEQEDVVAAIAHQHVLTIVTEADGSDVQLLSVVRHRPRHHAHRLQIS